MILPLKQAAALHGCYKHIATARDVFQFNNRRMVHLVTHYVTSNSKYSINLTLNLKLLYDYHAARPPQHRSSLGESFAEQRGQNNSDGEYMGFGLTERFDCLDWVKYMNSRFGT